MSEFWTNLVTVFLGSGAAVAITNWYIEHRREERRRTDETEFLAVKLAIEFEGYAIECAERVSDHKTAEDSGGHAGKRIGSLPEAPQLPKGDAYKFFDRNLLDDIYQFPQDCLMADRAAIFWWNVVGDEDCCTQAYEKNTIRMGVKASEIAKEIRRKNKLPSRTLTFGNWKIDKFLGEEMAKILEREDKKT